MTRTLLALALLAAASATTPARAETAATCTATITALPIVIGARGVYCLSKDLGTDITSGIAVTVQTNQVTIDCNGYRISGLPAGAGTTATGIGAPALRTLVTVRNCGIRGFARGISLEADASLVEGNHFEQNRIEGIRLNGDGNVVRNNRVYDTGGSTGEYSPVIGIYAIGNTDVRDNIIDTVVPTAAPNTNAYGIRHSGGIGVRLAGNVVRNLQPAGTGGAYGVYTSGSQQAFLDDNRVGWLSVAAPVSVAYRCNADLGSMRNNAEFGFITLNQGCIDGGGNTDH
jgi:parallel beta-helix repeat protein